MTRLGQHFLTDPNLLRKIVAALDPTPTDVVLEIGPGKGSLTRILAPLVGRVVAIEKDRRLAAELGAWNADGGTGHVEVVEGDALKLDWHVLLDTGRPAPRFKVIGNIPYYITSPLIEKALAPPLPERVVFLMQREVGERLAAAPGARSYGALSVGVQAACEVERLFVVKAGAFRPAPRVDSAVVRLTPLARPLVTPAETASFRAFVTTCFGRRRKQLRNAVMAATQRPAPVVTALLRDLHLSATARPETLTPAEFVALLRGSLQL